MEHEPKNSLPQAARYPLFMLGLIILLVGELAAYGGNAGVHAEAVIAVLACIFMVLSVALR